MLRPCRCRRGKALVTLRRNSRESAARALQRGRGPLRVRPLMAVSSESLDRMRSARREPSALPLPLAPPALERLFRQSAAGRIVFTLAAAAAARSLRCSESGPRLANLGGRGGGARRGCRRRRLRILRAVPPGPALGGIEADRRHQPVKQRAVAPALRCTRLAQWGWRSPLPQAGLWPACLLSPPLPPADSLFLALVPSSRFCPPSPLHVIYHGNLGAGTSSPAASRVSGPLLLDLPGFLPHYHDHVRISIRTLYFEVLDLKAGITPS